MVSRSRGQSIVAAAAYRAGDRLHDERYGRTHDYGRKAVEYSEIILPDQAPEAWRDRETLWNSVERAEKRADAQLAREIEVALPRELDRADQVALVREFVGREFVARGMVADFSVHAPRASDGEEAPHAHILLSLRTGTPGGWGQKCRAWNARALHEQWREAWETAVNVRLAVFPACAGMSRAGTGLALWVACVPRLRGDEPNWCSTKLARLKCSPPARG